METKCGLVAVVGAPNVGKSTLVNRLVGEKVGIVSRKANTTRITVRGVVTAGPVQAVFVDTPGLNESNKVFDRMLVQQAQSALAEADVVMLVLDAARGFDQRARDVMVMLKQGFGGGEGTRKAVLVLNKIDRVNPRSKLLALMTEAGEADLFAAVFAVDAQHGKGVDVLVPGLGKLLPEGPWLFPAEMKTDMPLPLRLAELTREKAMVLLQEEVPYSLMVQAVEMGEMDDGKLLVKQDLVVAQERHKGMVVGSGGQMLQKIGRAARLDMQDLLGRGLHLDLNVRVDARWQSRENLLQEMGLAE